MYQSNDPRYLYIRVITEVNSTGSCSALMMLYDIVTKKLRYDIGYVVSHELYIFESNNRKDDGTIDINDDVSIEYMFGCDSLLNWNYFDGVHSHIYMKSGKNRKNIEIYETPDYLIKTPIYWILKVENEILKDYYK